jgi:hypothetical protein
MNSPYSGLAGSTYRSSLTVLLRQRGVLMIDLGETVTPALPHGFDIANDIAIA